LKIFVAGEYGPVIQTHCMKCAQPICEIII
jgi:hypothetical protein